MNCLTKKNLLQKIIIVMLIALILIFSIAPNYNVVYGAESDPDQGGLIGTLLKEILNLIVQLGDIIMSALNHFMLGADGFSSAMLKVDNDNIDNPESWLYVPKDAETDVSYSEGEINTANIFSFIVGEKFEIPNMLYSPENIFANNIAALDVNFLRPNKYNAISDTEAAQSAAQSAVIRSDTDDVQSSTSNTLRSTIATWYKSFRNIAIVGLLSVLVYLGIRILISSTSVDKAKYKESLQDWLVALCLVFVIHFIMSGILMITDRFTDLFDQTIDEGITITANEGTTDEVKFRTNLIGYARFNAQSSTVSNTAAYSIIYLALVIYTCIFTFIYFRRFLYMAFFTMIAPLVALTYPIDRAGDGKAQAFNIWFKEYTMNAILQPVHLILYAALVSSAMDLVEQNMIYALVAIWFLIPAEKFIKKMFGFDKADTTSGFGSFAGGALAMSGVKQVASLLGKGKSKDSNNSKDTDSSTSEKPRMMTRERGMLGSFNEEGNGVNGENGNEENSIMQRDPRQTMQDEENREQNQWNNIEQNHENRNMPDFAQREGYMPDENHAGILLPTSYRMDQQQQQAREERENADQQRENHEQGNDLQVNQNEINRQAGWRRKRAIRGAKKLGKIGLKGAKIGARGLGIAGGATLGLSAGIASGGDLSKVLTYAGAGAVAGSTIGKSVGKLPEGIANFAEETKNSVEDKFEDYRYNRDKDMYGAAVATQRSAERINEREKSKFMNSKQQKTKYEEMAGRIAMETGNNSIKAEDLMSASFDYQKAGITDEKQIETGLTMEAKHGGVNGRNHDKMIDIVNLTKDYGKDYVLDEKKRNSMQDLIRTNVSNERNQNDVWNFYTEALGMKDMGRKYAINPSNNTRRRRR